MIYDLGEVKDDSMCSPDAHVLENGRKNGFPRQISPQQSASFNLAKFVFAGIVSSVVINRFVIPALRLDPKDFYMLMAFALTTVGMAQVTEKIYNRIPSEQQKKRIVYLTILAAISSGISGWSVAKSLELSQQPVSYKMTAAAVFSTPVFVIISSLLNRPKEKVLLPVHIQDDLNAEMS